MTATRQNIFEEKALGKAQDIRMLQKLYPFIKPYWMMLGLTVLLMISITAMDLLIPYITKIAIDRYIVPQDTFAHENQKKQDKGYTVDLSDPVIKKIVNSNPDLFSIHNNSAEINYTDLSRLPKSDIAKLREKDIKGVIFIAIYLIIIVMTSFCLNFALVMTLEYAGQMIMHDLRMTLFAHIQKLSIRFFTQNPVGRLVTRVTNDTQNMHEMFNSVIVFVLKDFFLIVGITVVLLSIDWRLALAVYTIFPLVFYASYKFASSSREWYRTLRIKAAQINAKFAETIGGIHVLQLFGQEKANFNSFKKINFENYRASMRQVTVFAVFMPFIELMSSTAVAIVIYYGGERLIAERITLGTLVAFISYLRLFFRPIRDIAEKYNITLNALSSAERISIILDDDDKLPEPAPDDAVMVPANLQELKFEQVSFSYVPDELVLNNISFTISSGETVAIVGPTGAGKTSIINLITRFYDPDSGKIEINGMDIRKINSSDLRSKMALVMQEPFLFSGSVQNNIFGESKKLNQIDIDRILGASYCKSFTDQLSEGLDTKLGEGGASLSSGQRQLISIARALAANPELIIFDEATSYIDSETEHKIQNALFNLTQNRTAIIVAHRLSTARIADKIIVLHHGKIIETGSHEHLMNKKGFYYRLVNLQG